MTAIHCRLLPLTDAAGPTNMASDEVLLHTAAEQGIASLRFYTWSAATLSLGYFQPQDLRSTTAKLAELPWVRRATGGAALVHHHEVTYALALPPGLPWQTKDSWMCLLHHAITAALEPLGVSTRSVICGEEKKLGEVLCFLHQTPGDLRIDAHKVVGSAQRKLRGALLQHGSILLQQSPFAPALPGIAELTGQVLTPATVAEALVQELQERLGWQFSKEEFTEAEMIQMRALCAEKYQSAHWNGKR